METRKKVNIKYVQPNTPTDLERGLWWLAIAVLICLTLAAAALINIPHPLLSILGVAAVTAFIVSQHRLTAHAHKRPSQPHTRPQAPTGHQTHRRQDRTPQR